MLQRSGRYDNGFVTILNDFQDMPRTMKQLAWVQFFSWFALFAMWIYTTPAVTSHIYGTTDTTSALYNEGANWVGVGFGAYNGVAAVVAFAHPGAGPADQSQDRPRDLSGLRRARAALDLSCSRTPGCLLVSMVGVGIAWASILAMPYAILTGSLPPSKMGYYMGVFNFFIVIPQIVAAALLGFLVGRFFGGAGDLRPRRSAARRCSSPRCSPCGWRTRTTGGWHMAPRILRLRRRTTHYGHGPDLSLPDLSRRCGAHLLAAVVRAQVQSRPESPPELRRPQPGPAAFWNSATIYFLLTDRFQNGDSTNDRALGPRAGRSGCCAISRAVTSPACCRRSRRATSTAWG